MTISVLVVDDQEMVRAGFSALLDAQADLEVVGQAGDGSEAVELAAELNPDVILMDVRMPVLDGLAATRQHPGGRGGRRPPRVIMLTTFDLDDYVYAALRAGRERVPAEALDPRRARRRGADRRGRRRTARALGHPPPGRGLRPGAARRPDRAGAPHAARDRRTAVGRSGTVQPADRGGARTGGADRETHVSNILTKLDLRDRAQAVVYAYESGVVAPGPRH